MTLIKVILPTSILAIEHTPLLKALRVHQVARWTAIFSVHEVVFYKEPTTGYTEFQEHEKLIKAHWNYFFTPPYLRKILIPPNPALRYVGALPPIRLEAFNTAKRPRVGEIRVGLVYREPDGRLHAHVGGRVPYLVKDGCEEGLRPVRVVSVEKKLVECVEKPAYLGPRLVFTTSLHEALEEVEKTSDFIIATDKKGSVPSTSEVLRVCKSRVAILFGSPKYDLFEIAQQEGISLIDHVDYVWNTVPGQRVVSIRTEEALVITLGVVNVFLSSCSER
ncbi:MAG: putative RNA uridine N3 methyltransferase [Desulfurococcaceae archaeon]